MIGRVIFPHKISSIVNWLSNGIKNTHLFKTVVILFIFDLVAMSLNIFKKL